MCIDYRKQNNNTIIQPYPIPNMDELLDSLGEANIFSSLDLKAGYHQVEIKESDKNKTAFITKDKLFEYNRLPFGLVNAHLISKKL